MFQTTNQCFFPAENLVVPFFGPSRSGKKKIICMWSKTVAPKDLQKMFVLVLTHPKMRMSNSEPLACKQPRCEYLEPFQCPRQILASQPSPDDSSNNHGFCAGQSLRKTVWVRWIMVFMSIWRFPESWGYPRKHPFLDGIVYLWVLHLWKPPYVCWLNLQVWWC